MAKCLTAYKNIHVQIAKRLTAYKNNHVQIAKCITAYSYRSNSEMSISL